MTQITLSVDEAIIAKVEQIAAARGTSVSVIFSEYVQTLDDKGARGIEIGPLTRQASGIIKLPPDKDYKELVAEAIKEKHGHSE